MTRKQRKKSYRKNPKLRDRLDPATEGSLGARKDAINHFAHLAVQYGRTDKIVFEGFQHELSPTQIRKALHKAVNEVVKRMSKRRS